jgi:2-keto-4-pentenoate hydratase
MLGIPYSLVAGLTRGTLEPPDLPHSLEGSTRVALEAEIAVRLGRAVLPDMSLAEVAACVEGWAPAIEIVDFNRPFGELEQILSEGVFHRALRLGAFMPPAPGADLQGSSVRVECSGENACEVNARAATGHVPEVLAHLARLLGSFGESLAASDEVILGAMNPLTFANPGATFSVSVSGMGSISVTVR